MNSFCGRPSSQRRPIGRAAPAGDRRDRSISCRPRARPRRQPACVRRARASAPIRSKFSSPKPIGSMILWHDAHAGLVRCASSRCRSEVAFTASGSFSRFVSMPGGGTGRRRAEQVFENPPAAVHGGGPRGHRRDRQHAALPQQPAPRAVRVERDAAEVAAVNIRDAVVARQPFVHERVVGVDQIDDASVFADDALEEHLGFAAKRLPQVLVEVLRGGLHARRARAGRATARQSCSSAPPTSDRRASASPAASRTLGSRSCPLPPPPAARRPECCSTERTTGATPRSRSLRRYAVPAPHAAGFGFDAEQERRGHQDARDHLLDAGFEIPFAAALLIERHQRVDFAGERGRRNARRASVVTIWRAHPSSLA